ncbi:MAG: H-NS histone family protein [Limimaricola soesokkakensis]|uniref:H-NS histone family protein n=1 Tax=Limimaricola soesokkakensis TaxID=1343159 RepID=UPI00405A4AB7
MKDLVGASVGKPSKSINPPKYRNPANGTQTWTGCGRQSQWIRNALAANQSLDDFLIAG